MSAPTALEERLDRVRAMVDRSVDPLRHPLELAFRPFDVEQHLRAWERLAELAVAGRLWPELVLYVHIPFCARVCGYCLLASRVSGGRERLRRYLAALIRQMDVYAPRVRGLRVRTVHLGGGTPTLLTADELDELFTALRARFVLDEQVELGVEAHPTTTTLEKLRVLARHGVGRVSFGVETFDPEVLAAVQRGDQTEASVEAAVAAARAAGIRQVNLDLLAGLPGETVASFERSVRKALALAPDSMSVNRYLAESSPLAAYGYVADADEHQRASEMLLAADRVIREARRPTFPREPLTSAGFGTQYVWDERGDARAYFQADMIGPASVLTLGHGVLGHLHGGGFYTSDTSLERWTDLLLAGDPPPVRAYAAGMRFERAFYLVDRVCRGTFEPAAFRRVFSLDAQRAFGPELALLERRGLLVREGEGAWHKPPSLTFQAAHLLAFLVLDGADATEVAPRATAASEPAALCLDVGDVADAVARLRSLERGARGVVRLRVGRALRADEATALRDAAERTGWGVEVERSDRDASLRQYGAIGAELPPSVLWCRIAMTAARAARDSEARSLVRG